MRNTTPAAPAAALTSAYAGITDVVSNLDETGLYLPTACPGWSVVDLLLHLTQDAQRALIALASPTDERPDVDSVTYWRRYPGVGDDTAAAAHARWVRRSAAAYDSPTGVVRLWCATAAAAARAAKRADPTHRIVTQDHVLTVSDFLVTLITEAVVHHLDLIACLPAATAPHETAMDVTLSTMEGLAAPAGLPARWGRREAVLKAAGRLPLDDDDRRSLGDRSTAYPLLR